MKARGHVCPRCGADKLKTIGTIVAGVNVRTQNLQCMTCMQNFAGVSFIADTTDKYRRLAEKIRRGDVEATLVPREPEL